MKKSDRLKTRKEIRADKKKASGKSDINEANQKNTKKVLSSGVSRFFGRLKKFFKRYWYWPVAIAVLATVVVVWLELLNITEKDFFIDGGDEEIAIYVNSYCSLAPKVKDNENASIKFYVEDGYESILSVNDSGVVFAKKEGEGKVIAERGKHKKTYYIKSVLYSATWVLGVGDRITRADIYEGLGSNLMFSVNGHIVETYNNNAELEDSDDNPISVLEMKESIDEEWFYEVVHEGICDIRLLAGDAIVCTARIYAYNEIEDSKRQFMREIPLFSLNGDLPKDDVRGTKELVIDEDWEVKPGKFSISGSIYYHSSNPDILKLSQNGKVRAYSEGNSLLSIICADANNNIEVQTYEIRVSSHEIYFWKGKEENESESKDIYIGEVISEQDLKRFYYGERVDTFTADERVFERIVKSDGIYFEVKDYPSGEEKYGEIYALDKTGIVLARYRVLIKDPTSSEEDEW